MKIVIIFLTIVLFNFGNIFAQSGKINVFSHYADSNLCFRFGVDNYNDFKSVAIHGFTIKRITLIQNSDTLSQAQQLATQITLVNHLLPKQEQWILDSLPASDFRNLLKEGLYSTGPDTNINFTTPRLVDAINFDKQNQGRLFAILYAAEQNFNLAKAAGLGYIDQSAVTDRVYQYYISVEDSSGVNKINPVVINVSTFQDDIFKQVQNLKAEGKPNNIELSWVKTPDSRYSGYDIFRSADSINFSKINVIPFVHFKTADVTTNEVVFVDSVGPGVSYFYKVYGISPFGTYSESSLIVKAKSLYPRINNLVITIPEIESTMEEVQVDWQMDVTFNQDLQGFNVYRSEFYDGSYIKLNNSILQPFSRRFIDANPLAIGYYFVDAIDLHDNVYLSTPKMVYLPDSIPPAAPEGLTARYFGNSKVELNWNSNVEEDLAGYRVEMSNHRTGTFIQITQKHITTNNYDYYTDPNVVSDSIFFRVFAQDKRGNYSDRSLPFGCKRPDIVPPAKPDLSKAMATRDGIELGWSYSPTKSVTGYRLERKPAGTPTWTTVLSFPASNKHLYMPSDTTEFNYLDTTKLEFRSYEYRFIAEETQSITSASGSLFVTPLPIVLSSQTIKNFKLDKEIETARPNPIIQEQINNLRKAEGSTRFSAAMNTQQHIRLTWTYNLDPNLQDFQIFRAISGSGIILYRTITIAEAMGLDPATQQVVIDENMGMASFSILDRDLMTGRRYTYQVVARHKDLSSTPRSIALSKKIEAN